MLARIRKSIEDKDQGFTLIELLVVIIIIGILAAIAIPVFLNQRKKATEASMKSDLRTVANEMETYFTDNQTYPVVASGTGTVTVGTNAVTLSKGNTLASTTTGAVAGTFCLTATNTDVAAGVSYVYDSDKGGLIKAAACS